jgi:hypothetical protein
MLHNIISKVHNFLIQCLIGVSFFVMWRARGDASFEITYSSIQTFHRCHDWRGWLGRELPSDCVDTYRPRISIMLVTLGS